MKKVYLSPLLHKEEWQIAIRFKFDPEIKIQVTGFEKVKWSQTHQCYYVQYSHTNKQLLYKKLRDSGIYVDYSGMLKFQLPQKKNQNPPSNSLKLKKKCCMSMSLTCGGSGLVRAV